MVQLVEKKSMRDALYDLEVAMLAVSHGNLTSAENRPDAENARVTRRKATDSTDRVQVHPESLQ